MQQPDERTRSVVSMATMEIAVAFLFFVVGAVVMFDSYRLGASWDVDGPQAGYFPFWIGLLICVSSAIVFVQGVAQRLRGSPSFVGGGQLKDILWVLLPAVAYVFGIQLIGIYIASAFYIMLFMVFLGKYNWPKSIAVGVGVGSAAFAVFEIWFRIPLPKGFVERAFGY